MAERIAQIIVLAEDLNQVNFAYHYLRRKGHEQRTIRVVPVSGGRGSGEQHVRERYPGEVRHYRSRSPHTKVALVVAIDADISTVAQRENELETALAEVGELRRQADEAIVLLIPKRHIETWILCLLGEHVDEVTGYKSRGDVHQQIKPAALTFYE